MIKRKMKSFKLQNVNNDLLSHPRKKKKLGLKANIFVTNKR